MKLSLKRTKIRRFRRTQEGEHASAWLEQLVDTDATAPPASTAAGHLPPRRTDLYDVRPGTPFARPRNAVPARRAPRPVQRVIAGYAPAPEARTEQLPVIREDLAPVRVAGIPQLAQARAPQPRAGELRPVQAAQALPGRTLVLKVPPAPTYAERLAAVWDAAQDRLTELSGWANNRRIDDDQVTHARFMHLRDRYADLLPPLRALAGAR
jgi:hypothetical protein